MANMFKNFIKKMSGKKDVESEKKDRAGHLAWDAGDLEHHADANRISHLAWNADELEHHYDDDVQEAYYTTIGGETKHYDTHFSGVNLGSVPKKWEKGKISQLAKDIENRRQQPKPYFSKHPDQQSLPLKGGKNPTGHYSNPTDYNFDPETKTHHNHEELSNMFMAHHAKLKGSHLRTIESYKSVSEHFNNDLRNSKGKEVELHHHEAIKDLDHITSARTTKDLTLYRGVGRKWAQMPHFDWDKGHVPVGHTFTDHGFSGLTPKPQIARSFNTIETTTSPHHQDDSGWGTQHKPVFRIHVPKGTKAHFLDMHDASPHTHEHEVLMQRGTKYRVMGAGKNPFGGTVVDLKVVGQRKTRVKPFDSLMAEP